ncbi:hypothetical protein OAF54_01065 [bacterium]|nr:hypothetical protein [bacterium]
MPIKLQARSRRHNIMRQGRHGGFRVVPYAGIVKLRESLKGPYLSYIMGQQDGDGQYLVNVSQMCEGLRLIGAWEEPHNAD